jgi:hypothetical protein
VPLWLCLLFVCVCVCVCVSITVSASVSVYLCLHLRVCLLACVWSVVSVYVTFCRLYLLLCLCLRQGLCRWFSTIRLYDLNGLLTPLFTLFFSSFFSRLSALHSLLFFYNLLTIFLTFPPFSPSLHFIKASMLRSTSWRLRLNSFVLMPITS